MVIEKCPPTCHKTAGFATRTSPDSKRLAERRPRRVGCTIVPGKSIIRPVQGQDAAGVAAVYAPNVTDTVISFETEPPDAAEMARRIEATVAAHPWLVCERAGEIVGYAYASSHNGRAAYRWSVNVTVYIDRRLHRSGIGRALYTSLFALLRLQGFYNAYAGITLPNAGSVGLHEAMGFQPVGVYREVGCKFGAWHDVGWWSLELQPRPANQPPVPLTPAQLAALPCYQEAGEAGTPLLRV